MLLCARFCCAGELTINPTTTLAAQTSNNTSAANTFVTQSNGNLGATNVSKVDVHSLLYAGASTKIYAHLMLWFGRLNHMNVGYSSTDAGQIKQQIADMVSRGINGVIIDWYGPNNSIDQATQLVMSEAEAHPGFTFAIMVDKGAIEWDSCPGCTPQQALTQQLQYVEQTYFSSSAYLKIGGQPVVTNFDIDLHYTIDWNALNASLASNPVFLFQNSDGFSHVLSGGSYSWVIPTTSDYGMSYLTGFYATGKSSPKEQTVGATYKGFNDTLAEWGSNRIMGQQCGQTWLQTFSTINGLYDSSSQLAWLQLVTWNDYEEGTEIESGIDNCVTVSAVLSGNSLQWSVSGNENTIDHYTVYVSKDGQNLMPLADLAAGLHSVDLCSFALPADSYTLYVQAIGKPTLSNQMSGPVGYTADCPGTGASLVLTASPSPTSLMAGQSATIAITAISQAEPFNDPVSFSCSGLPVGMVCSFSPSVVTPGALGATSVLTVSTAGLSSGARVPRSQPGRVPIYAFFSSFGVAGFVVFGRARSKRAFRSWAVSLAIAAVALLASCGGGHTPVQTSAIGVSPGTYAIQIKGNSGKIQVSTIEVITVR